MKTLNRNKLAAMASLKNSKMVSRSSTRRSNNLRLLFSLETSIAFTYNSAKDQIR